MPQFTILGGTGFIGRNLVAYQRSTGNDVFVPVRGDSGLYSRPLGHLIYCAGISGGHRSRPFDNVRAHITLLADVLERADFASLVYLSSTRVYSSSSHGSEDLPIAVNPGDADQLYNLSKLTGEALLAASQRPGLKVARLSNVAGLNPESTTFLSSLIQDALAGHICLRSDSLSVRDYIHIDDVTAMLTKIATEGTREKYNVASGVNVTNRDIVNRLSELTGCTTSVEPDAPLHRLPAIDTERIRSEFRFKPMAVLDSLPFLVGGYRHWARGAAENLVR